MKKWENGSQIITQWHWEWKSGKMVHKLLLDDTRNEKVGKWFTNYYLMTLRMKKWENGSLGITWCHCSDVKLCIRHSL